MSFVACSQHAHLFLPLVPEKLALHNSAFLTCSVCPSLTSCAAFAAKMTDVFILTFPPTCTNVLSPVNLIPDLVPSSLKVQMTSPFGTTTFTLRSCHTCEANILRPRTLPSVLSVIVLPGQ